MSPRTKHNLIQTITFAELGLSIYLFHTLNLFGIQDSLEKGIYGFGAVVILLNMATLYLLEKIFNHRVTWWISYLGKRGRSDKYFSRIRVVFLMILVLIGILTYIQVFNVSF